LLISWFSSDSMFTAYVYCLLYHAWLEFTTLLSCTHMLTCAHHLVSFYVLVGLLSNNLWTYISRSRSAQQKCWGTIHERPGFSCGASVLAIDHPCPASYCPALEISFTTREHLSAFVLCMSLCKLCFSTFWWCNIHVIVGPNLSL